MVSLNSTSGYIGCARGNQGLYKYDVDKQGNFNAENLIKKGHFLDMLYFDKFDTLFLHEDKKGEVLKLDSLG
jgi:hypothetical protein